MRRVLFGVLLLALAGCRPERPEVWAQRGREAYGAGLYAKAIAAYEKVLALGGEHPATYYN